MSKNETKNYKDDREDSIVDLFIGIVLLAAGLFMLSKRVIVHTGWYRWNLGGFYLSSGTIVIPLMIGVIWYFYNPKSLVSKAIIALSAMFIVLSIIMSVSINFIATSMFDYLLILGMIAAGCGILLRILLSSRKRKNSDNDSKKD